MKLIYPHFDRTNKCTVQVKYFIKMVFVIFFVVVVILLFSKDVQRYFFRTNGKTGLQTMGVTSAMEIFHSLSL